MTLIKSPSFKGFRITLMGKLMYIFVNVDLNLMGICVLCLSDHKSQKVKP